MNEQRRVARTSEDDSGPLRRLRGSERIADAIDAFSDRAVSVSDLRSALLSVAQRRSENTDAAQVLRQYMQDRFVTPATTDAVALARASAALLESLASSFEPVGLAPLVPLGTHRLGATPQNNVVTTTRMSEVAADPTNALVLEAARRQREGEQTSGGVTRLSGVQRVTRAQRFDGPVSFAHFSLLGVVSMGRSRGSRRVEIDEHVTQLAGLATAVRAARPDLTSVEVRISDFDPRGGDTLDAAVDALRTLLDDVTVEVDPHRTHGHGYYSGLCSKLHVSRGDTTYEVGDGGVVGWGAELLADAKQRTIIAGIGIDRLVMI